MRNLTILFAVLFAATLYNPPAGLAQSSGSVSASFGTTQCSIAPNDGSLSGGISGNSLPEVTMMDPKKPCLPVEVMSHMRVAGDHMPAQDHHRYTASPSQVDPPAPSL